MCKEKVWGRAIFILSLSLLSNVHLSQEPRLWRLAWLPSYVHKMPGIANIFSRERNKLLEGNGKIIARQCKSAA